MERVPLTSSIMPGSNEALDAPELPNINTDVIGGLSSKSNAPLVDESPPAGQRPNIDQADAEMPDATGDGTCPIGSANAGSRPDQSFPSASGSADHASKMNNDSDASNSNDDGNQN